MSFFIVNIQLIIFNANQLNPKSFPINTNLFPTIFLLLQHLNTPKITHKLSLFHQNLSRKFQL
ncbi:hypothetical protein HanRHA438_Chr05g0229351 [Helianthus annuus]|nr:hypothetical protein HanHA300_Chr05g0180391 [Helianthus annuus]KAJ0577530.1 hypothetical protein HanIR_Chr05g0237041 [Helianthus annuus]KAJ0584984.1 hypothetical protein HanHA89_Chr05g0195081 [Helianthus annuus]KAJ0919411.1 hypothetical protein HanRHA438_Chr05g0229351 [Helianthus annuus]